MIPADPAPPCVLIVDDSPVIRRLVAEHLTRAGFRVVHENRGGTIRETVAMSKVYAHVRESDDRGELLSELVTSPPALDRQKVQSADDLVRMTSDRLREALALWRGTPELPDGSRGVSEKTRWIEGHAALVEGRADALLDLHAHPLALLGQDHGLDAAVAR